MAYTCILGHRCECNGCGKCQYQEQPIVHCSWCDEEIHMGEVYYSINNEMICEDCIEDCKGILE